YIKDNAASTYSNDIKDMQPGNYQYDATGNLVADKNDHISWTVYGKIQTIRKGDGTVIDYTYDAAGNRISKTVRSSAAAGGVTTWYVRDAQGNVLDVYTAGDQNINNGQLTQTEIDLYGSTRLGMLQVSNNVNSQLNTPGDVIALPNGGTAFNYTFVRGSKLFELTNHLGNVLATVSDRRQLVSLNNTTIDHYEPVLLSATDYYPFGMEMPGRVYSGGKYRYGFNGKENDNEVKGEGNSLDFGSRIYDSRLGRWYSTDMHPKTYQSPYSFARNSPNNIIDPDGNDEFHFHYLTTYIPVTQAGADGILHIVNKPVNYTWVQVIKDNLKNTFYVHKDIAKANGSTSPSTPTQFFPDPAVNAPATGVTRSDLFGGILGNVKDDDYTALLKILDNFPELEGYVSPASIGGASTDKNRAFGDKVYKDKNARATAEKEESQVNQLMIGVLTSVAGELVFGGTMSEAFAKLPDAAKINAIRMAANVKEGANIAFIEGEVGGETFSSIGISGEASRPMAVGNPSNRVFVTKATGANQRMFDSEVKLFEDFAAKYGNTRDVSGTIKIVSERPFCVSCSGVTDQFRKMFPNIKVEVINGIK
ncbi:deaminase domain-containing protein, partial [Deminuibacter soli]